MTKPIRIEAPKFIMYEQGGKLICRVHRTPGVESDTHKAYGLYICDLVRHVANAFKVHEDDVWEWIDKERHHPTTEIRELPQPRVITTTTEE